MKSRIKVSKAKREEKEKTKNEDIEDVIQPSRKVKATSPGPDILPPNDNVESTIEDD